MYVSCPVFCTRHVILSLTPRNGTVNYSQTAASEIDVVYWLFCALYRPQVCMCICLFIQTDVKHAVASPLLCV